MVELVGSLVDKFLLEESCFLLTYILAFDSVRSVENFLLVGSCFLADL